MQATKDAIDAVLDRHAPRDAPLSLRDLAINGDDLMRECGATPGPKLGRVLDELLEAVITDSTLNQRALLIDMACTRLAAVS